MGKIGCWMVAAMLCLFGMRPQVFAQTSSSAEVITSASAPTAEQKKLWIAIIPPSKKNPFWRQLCAGAIKAGDELGAGVLWQGPADEEQAGEQADTIRVFTRMRVEAIVLSPLPDAGVAQSIRDAERRNVRVILIESEPKGEDYTSLIASNNYKAGVEAGSKMGKELDGKGKVLLLRYSLKASDAKERERGFLDVMRSKYPTLELVSIDQYGGETDEAAQKKAYELVKKYGASLNGVFTSHEITTFALLHALRKTAKSDKICFIGFDASPSILQAVESGEMTGILARSPFLMGYLAVKTAVAAAHGETVSKRQECNALWLTKKTLEDAVLKDVFMPDLSKLPK
ncbi:MAG: substrate-binding domain-containing protein [Candidatus Sumerlaeota bacterium]|nr:substrate-binding domain-containing protein [Candidatus Sumerlaeota bacterium]